MMMNVDDKKGKKKMFSEEEKIDTATTTTTSTTTTESEIMTMDVDDDEKGKKKMSLEEAKKLRIESLVAKCSYYAMAQNPYTLRLRLGIDNKENKIIKKNSSVSAVDHHGGSSSSSVCRDKNQVQPTRKVVFAEDDVEKHHHHHHHHHSKLSENQNGLRFRIPKRKPDENPNPNAEESKCVVCGKIFNSKKSLYGHMRSHPKDQTLSATEMRSSHHHSSSSPSTSIISADSMNKSSSLNLVISTTEVKREGLELNLPRWLKKEKRGRRALTKEEIARKKLKREGAYTGNKQHTPLLHEKDLQRDGDQDLVITGKQLEKLETDRADPVLTITVETQGIDEVEVANNMATSEEVVINPKQAELDDERVVNIPAGSDQYKDDGIVMENESFRPEKPWNSNMLPHEFTRENRVKVEGGINAMEIKQKKTLTSSLDGTYRCSECNKCFSSHQALGGHKSSHSTKKPKDVLASTSGAALEYDTRCGLVLNSTHQCKICYKSFPSGQALGGHQRSHYVQPMVPGGKEFTFDHKSAPVVKEATFELKPAAVIQELNIDIRPMVPEAVVQELNIDIRPVVERDFDLNELPVLEGEEVDTACTALSISTPQPIQAA